MKIVYDGPDESCPIPGERIALKGVAIDVDDEVGARLVANNPNFAVAEEPKLTKREQRALDREK